MCSTNTSSLIKPTVMVVDDSPVMLATINGILSHHYHVNMFGSPEVALNAVSGDYFPDLILLDVMMPEMDGYTFLKRLLRDSQNKLDNIPVIFLTSANSAEDEELGFSLGAVDYIQKPINSTILLARMRVHINAKLARDQLRLNNSFKDIEIDSRLRENLVIKDASFHALALLAEIRDPESANHLHRTQAFVLALAKRLSHNPRYKSSLSEAQINLIMKAAPLHDIGKVGIPDEILLKPGKLTLDEFETMKTHASLGKMAIETAIKRSSGIFSLDLSLEEGDTTLSFLDVALQIVGSHHEKWDGSGYPNGLIGDALPLSAQLMALADVYDALSSRRPYKEPFSESDVIRIILEGSGLHFNPDIVDAFIDVKEQFSIIAKHYSDHEA